VSQKTDPSELGVKIEAAPGALPFPSSKAPLFVVDPDQPEPLLKQSGTCRIGTPVGKIYGLLHPKDGEASWDALSEDLRRMWTQMDGVVEECVVLPAVKHAVREERLKRLASENKLFELEEERRLPFYARMVRAGVSRLQALLERWENR
jgi:hypothetical protein